MLKLFWWLYHSVFHVSIYSDIFINYLRFYFLKFNNNYTYFINLLILLYYRYWQLRIESIHPIWSFFRQISLPQCHRQETFWMPAVFGKKRLSGSIKFKHSFQKNSSKPHKGSTLDKLNIINICRFVFVDHVGHERIN